MALSNLFGWAQKMGRLPPRPAGKGPACGAGDKPEEKARGLQVGLRRRGQITSLFSRRVSAGFLKV